MENYSPYIVSAIPFYYLNFSIEFSISLSLSFDVFSYMQLLYL